MQRKSVYLLFRKFTMRVSGASHTHNQEYTKRGQASLAMLEGGSCTKKI